MRKLTLLASSLAFIAAICSASAAEIALAPFYKNLAVISAADKPLGTVVAREPVETAVPNAEAWRIAYVTSDVRGQKTLSTGLVVVPKGAPPAGGRPIVAWAHGTTGTSQYCGPSQVLDPVQELNEYFLVGGTSWTDFGIPGVAHFIEKGYAVVATDYQGLGGGGRHQYGVANSNARDAINSVRAVGSLGLAGEGKKALIYGWSQGGGATIASASLKDYMAETGTAYDGVSYVGFVALAPDDLATTMPEDATSDDAAPKFMQKFTETFSDNVFDFAHLSMYAWGMTSAYPELKLTDLFSEEGAKALDEIYAKKCMHPGSDTINFTFGAGYKALLKPQPENAVAWAKALIESSVTPVAPVAPVIIYFGTADTVVPPVMGEIYQKQMCGRGGNVARVQLEGAQSHFTTPPVAQPLYVPWIDDRFAGKPLDNGCPAN